ncbi:MAG: hypothetical protein D3925_19150 [Candidatus Electrothrix sp. AR5]|nr:hypothetical protein [Candidatus Electrothrix sp. AR5]
MIMNISDMMQQAKDFQKKMGDMQEELATQNVIGSAGGGMVTATMNGRGELVGLALESIPTPDSLIISVI